MLLSATLLGTPSNHTHAKRGEAGPAQPEPISAESPRQTPIEQTPVERDEREPNWVVPLQQHIARIDQAFPGELGVYVKRLADGKTLEYQSDRRWYLASTVKIPVAISVLQEVEAGRLSLDQRIELQPTDFVDGAGDLKWQSPGRRYRISKLIEKSLENSDSIATDMLIRVVGLNEINDHLRGWTDNAIGPITTILQVRYDAYGSLHPHVALLSNQVLLGVRAAGSGEARLSALAQALGIHRTELAAESLEALFERYYEQNLNAGQLDAFGTLLERLVTGQLLEAEHTERLLRHMQRITTGKRRIEATLPPGVPFAQKTGTQIARACNVGVIHPEQRERSVIVAACVAHHERVTQAEKAFQKLGHALTQVGLVERLYETKRAP